MSSKSKKKLKFLNVEKRNKLQQKLISEKQHYAEEFKRYFHECYQPYLEHFPHRRILFDSAIKMEYFDVSNELLILVNLSHYYFQESYIDLIILQSV